ncbi:MAG: transposase [Pseudarthrobacter sp.]
MSSTRRRFSQEFKDELCREVIDSSKPIKAVATEYGVGAETLRSWLTKYKEAHGGVEVEPGLNVSERARLKELERENQELKAEAAFLKKAAAYFAREPR